MTAKKLIGRLATAALAACAAVAFAAPVAAQQAQTYPTDEASLYAAAQKEGSLVWYVSGPLEAMKAVATTFEKKYPGIHVEVQRLVGVAQYQKFVQETQAHQYVTDLVSISDQPSIKSLADMGLLADWKIPTSDRFPDDMHVGNFSYAPYTNDNVIVYNPTKVTPDEVKLLSTWKGLLDPVFKGRIAITDQTCGACYAMVHMATDPKFQDEYGWNFLTALAAQQPTVYSDIISVADRVLVGEKDVGVWPAEGIPYLKWKQGAPIRWTHPSPTPVEGTNWSAISAFAPHPNAARLFQDWTLGDEGALAYENIYGAVSAMSGVPDQRDVTKEDWYQPITQKYVPDMERWTKDFGPDMERWGKMLRDASR
ncbi:MAG TPA: extracellular solute-binding protein [Devosiaceae bacterium]|jgi:ABC-type Fe3+ transport system substrate-binding protein